MDKPQNNEKKGKELTDGEKDVLEFLASQRDPMRCYATFRDVSEHFGQDIHNSMCQIESLQKSGLIQKINRRGVYRGIRLTKEGANNVTKDG